MREVRNKADSQLKFYSPWPDEEPFFAQYTRLLSRHKRELLRAIARGDGAAQPMSKGFIQNHRLGAASTVSSTLKMLMKNEILVKDDGGFMVHDLLLSRWLGRE